MDHLIERIELIGQPWQNALDFDRGEYVANLPKGEESIVEKIEDLRAKTEQVCHLPTSLARTDMKGSIALV